MSHFRFPRVSGPLFLIAATAGFFPACGARGARDGRENDQ